MKALVLTPATNPCTAQHPVADWLSVLLWPSLHSLPVPLIPLTLHLSGLDMVGRHALDLSPVQFFHGQPENSVAHLLPVRVPAKVFSFSGQFKDAEHTHNFQLRPTLLTAFLIAVVTQGTTRFIKR